MGEKINLGILIGLFLILLLIFSFTSFWIYEFLGIFLILALVILGLSISIVMTNKVTKSSNSLKAKIYFGFLLNFLIFVTILFFWYLGSNPFRDEWGWISMTITALSGICTLLGFIIGLILSIKRKEKKEFEYNLRSFFWIFNIATILLLVLLFYNTIIMSSALATNNNNLCYFTISASSNSYLFSSTYKPACLTEIAIAEKNEEGCNQLKGGYRQKCYIWVAVAKKDIKICIDNADSSSERLRYNDYCSTAIKNLEEEIYNILKIPTHQDIIYAIKSTPELNIYFDDSQSSKYIPLLKEIVKLGALDAKKESLNILFSWAGQKSLEEEKIILTNEILPIVKTQPELKSYVDKINIILAAEIIPPKEVINNGDNSVPAL